MVQTADVLNLINQVKSDLIFTTQEQSKINEKLRNFIDSIDHEGLQQIFDDYLNKIKFIKAKEKNIGQLSVTILDEKKSIEKSEELISSAEKTLETLDNFLNRKKKRNLEKSKIVDIMLGYWNAIGIKLKLNENNSNITLHFENHDEPNLELRNHKIEMNISEDNFEVLKVEPEENFNKIKQIEKEIKENGKSLSYLIFKLYTVFVIN